MYELKKYGYMPGYGADSPYGFTRKFPIKVSISMDTVATDMEADFRVLVQSEPPNLFQNFRDMVIAEKDKFDLILTYNEHLLELPQANEFCAVGSWISDDINIDKKNEISFIMSSKINGIPYHMRFMVMRMFERLENNKLNDFTVNWHRSPPKLPSKNPFFANAKFNVACENQDMPNMFTEKLLDCFKTYTVPIYFGCTNIEKYFNPKGILRFTSFDQFTDIVTNLTPSVYDEMLPYLQENYELAKSYWEKNVFERIEDEIEKAISFDISQDPELFQTLILD